MAATLTADVFEDDIAVSLARAMMKKSFNLRQKVMNMETITHSHVQDLVMQLPIQKLPLVYNLLVDLTTNEKAGLSPQLDFMRLPLSERRRIMAQQAEQMVAHYVQTAGEREIWQGGDFADEY